MSHTPFILASYLVGTVILLWIAIAPVLAQRGLVRQLQARQLKMDQNQ